MLARTAALAAALSLSLAPAALADTPATLSANGSGAVFITPDVATISLEVVRTAPSSRAALSAANRRTDVVVGALRGVGVAQAGIQTSSIDVTSYVVRIHKRRVRQFTATEDLSARITNIAEVGPAIDAATRAGADSINGPSFSFSDPSAGMIAAEAAALADARRQANAAAAAIGYGVTGVQSVALNPQSGVVVPTNGSGSARSLAAPPKTPTNVHPGVQEVDATVAVVFTIAPVAT